MLTYIASLIFNSDFAGKRSASYLWLEPDKADKISNIVISAPEQQVELTKRNGSWFVTRGEKEFPAKQLRVEDFIGIFTKRAPWIVRSSSAGSSHERLGLETGSAVRVTMSSENQTESQQFAAPPLLDLLFGSTDATGLEVYVRRYGENEVRSGDNSVSSFLKGNINNWFNLKLISETENGKIGLDSVQRLSVYTQNADAQVFSRRNRQWVVSGLDAVNLDQSAVDNYIRTVINTEGDDFADFSSGDPMFDYNRIVIELGTGQIKTICLSDADETGRRYANIDGTDYVYSIAPWAAQKLLTNLQDFQRQ